MHFITITRYLYKIQSIITMRYPPDEITLHRSNGSVLISNHSSTQKHSYQQIDIRIIPIQNTFTLIHKKDVDPLAREKITSRQAQQAFEPFMRQEFYLYDSTDNISSTSIIISKLQTQMSHLRSQGVHFHLLCQPRGKSIALLIVGLSFGIV